MFKIFHKSRKHPIQYDEYDQSLRKRCFELFNKGWRPSQVISELDMKPKTAYRYFQSWKLLLKDSEITYKQWRREFRNHTEFSESVIDMLSEYLNETKADIILRLQKPGGLKSLLKGEWAALKSKESQSQQEKRLRAALSLVHVIEIQGVTPEWIEKELSNLLPRARSMKIHRKLSHG